MNVIAYKQSYTVTLLKQIQTQRIIVFGISQVLKTVVSKEKLHHYPTNYLPQADCKVTLSCADKPKLVKDECQDQHDNSKDQASPA